MKLSVRTIALAVTFACALSSSASAGPIDYATPGVVGTLDGKLGNSNPSTELTIAQEILDLVGLGAFSPVIGTSQYYRASTDFDYSATLSNPLQSLPNAFVVPSGFRYVLAKYDGENAGYVLFHLPTFGSNELPQYPANFWTTQPDKWAISHFTTFNTTFDIASVPDGGSTVALLGSALFAVGYLRRRFVGILYDSPKTDGQEIL